MNTTPIRFSPRRLKEARGNRRPEELAVAAGVSSQSIRNWENGEYEPNATPLARIAQFLGVPLDSLFEFESSSSGEAA